MPRSIEIASVYKDRLDRAQIGCEQAGVGALLITPSTTFRYFTGLSPGRSERLIALVIPMKGKASIVSPAFEAPRLKENPLTEDLRLWREEENPHRLVQQFLVERGVHPSRLALEETTDFRTVVGCREVFGQDSFLDGRPILSKLRMKKDPTEVKRISRATQQAHRAFRRASKRLKPGIREVEFQKVLRHALAQEGGEEPWALVQFGATSAIPHAYGGRRKLGKNSAVLVDFGAAYEGYQADITRSFFLGRRPPAEFLRIRDTVRKAHDAATAYVRPGVTAESVDGVARRIIEEAGYGKFFTHRTGHGIGLDVHEEPYLVRGNSQVLAEGVTFTIEPGIYLPDRFGFRWENDVLVTATGCRILSQERSEVFA